MPKPFDELRERLLRAGIAPRHVRRYLAELDDHLADLRAEEERAGLSPEAANAAALARLGRIDELTRAMTGQRKFRSWSVRAPWAIFGLGPIFALWVVWLVAVCILWTGWQIFLPGADSPFVPVHGFAAFYFGIGRLLYFAAPVLVGWAIGFIAIRQRYRASWPAAGLILLAWMGGMAKVNANRTVVQDGIKHVDMQFTLGNSIPGISSGILRVLIILVLVMLPYIAGQIRKASSLSA